MRGVVWSQIADTDVVTRAPRVSQCQGPALAKDGPGFGIRTNGKNKDDDTAEIR